MTQQPTFKVAFTADFYDDQGQSKFPELGMDVLEPHSHLQQSVFDHHQTPIAAEQLRGVHGVIVLTPAVTADSLRESDDLLAIGRFGVGYDAVDVAACTDADVLLFITAGAVDRSVAEATVGWMIALSHHMLTKDRLVREGRWDDRTKFMGGELRDKTLGVIGLGGIGRATLQLLSGFGMKRPLGYDPFVKPEAAEKLGVELVELEDLLRRSDFVSIHCPLTPETRNLLVKDQLALMKPDAYLINTARGGIVDEDALYDLLRERKIAGAALDCFADEPITQPHRFGDLDNVLLAPHSIAWTNELFRDIGRVACQGMIDLSFGKAPRGTINPEVLRRPSFRRKWSLLSGVAVQALPVEPSLRS